jgi:hypothetical protein
MESYRSLESEKGTLGAESAVTRRDQGLDESVAVGASWSHIRTVHTLVRYPLNDETEGDSPR